MPLSNLHRSVFRKLLHAAQGLKTSRITLRPSQLQFIQCQCLSTSKKDRDSTTITGQIEVPAGPGPTTKTAKHYGPDPSAVTGTKRYWKSYGFDYDDPDTDLNDKNFAMFWTVTIGLVLFSFLVTYWPENKLRDWSQREGYIELARREALGLPHVDPNLVPPENINLPTDEELGDYPIII